LNRVSVRLKILLPEIVKAKASSGFDFLNMPFFIH